MKRYIIEEVSNETHGNGCDGCIFSDVDCTMVRPAGCLPESRDDGKYVFFVLVKNEDIEADKCQKS